MFSQVLGKFSNEILTSLEIGIHFDCPNDATLLRGYSCVERFLGTRLFKD